MDERGELKARLLALIERGEGDFDALARALFAWQHDNNAALRGFCERAGVRPEAIRRWEELPTVPTEVFRFLPLFCGAPAEAAAVFRTSGTTAGARGEHFLRELTLYHASARGQIEAFLLPDGAPRPALILAPPPEEAPDSSLSSMLGLIAREYARGEGFFAWSGGALALEEARGWLREAARGQRPVQVLATSFALVALLDAMAAQGEVVALPEGSTLMATGGTKGRAREVSAEALELEAAARLGIDVGLMIHEYGMTELGSQFYDPRARRAAARLPAWPRPSFQGPRWCRVTAHDPETLRAVPLGERGLLRFTDLSNLDSVCSVQTSDQGRILEASEAGDTFLLEGRAPGATPRGCSLLIEEAQRGRGA